MIAAGDVIGLVLAGGQSRRMGRDKSFLSYRGVPLFERAARTLDGVCKEVYISCTDPDLYRTCGRPVLGDTYGGRGPLDGIAAALKMGDLMVLAADLPLIPLDFLNVLPQVIGEADGALFWEGERVEPLAAFYRQRTVGRALKVLESPDRSVRAWLKRLSLKRLSVADIQPWDERIFLNVNDPESYEHLIRSGEDR